MPNTLLDARAVLENAGYRTFVPSLQCVEVVCPNVNTVRHSEIMAFFNPVHRCWGRLGTELPMQSKTVYNSTSMSSGSNPSPGKTLRCNSNVKPVYPQHAQAGLKIP